MGNYVLAYRGGAMAATAAEQQAALQEWMNWFESLGAAVIDAGAPFGPSSTVASNGNVTDGGSSGLSGYSIVAADSLSDAIERTKGCPLLANGGEIDVYEPIAMGPN